MGTLRKRVKSLVQDCREEGAVLRFRLAPFVPWPCTQPCAQFTKFSLLVATQLTASSCSCSSESTFSLGEPGRNIGAPRRGGPSQWGHLGLSRVGRGRATQCSLREDLGEQAAPLSAPRSGSGEHPSMGDMGYTAHLSQYVTSWASWAPSTSPLWGPRSLRGSAPAPTLSLGPALFCFLLSPASQSSTCTHSFTQEVSQQTHLKCLTGPVPHTGKDEESDTVPASG